MGATHTPGGGTARSRVVHGGSPRSHGYGANNGLVFDNGRVGPQALDEDSLAYLNRFDKLEFCFQHPDWSHLIDATICLEQVFRQTNQTFIQMLHRLRFGRCTPEDVKELYRIMKASTMALQREMGGPGPPNAPAPESTAPPYVFMYAVNREVDKKNDEELAKLPGERYTFNYTSKMTGANDTNRPVFKAWVEEQCKNSLAKPQIVLAEGAQVMLVANLDVKCGLL